MRSIRRPKNLAERLLRISTLHIFELYLFGCCLFTSEGCAWLAVESVERHPGGITIIFEEYAPAEWADSYAIVDDEDVLVAQRYLDQVVSGDLVRVFFEVQT